MKLREPVRLIGPRAARAAAQCVCGSKVAHKTTGGRNLRFALELSGAGATADPRLLADLARLAEESGWDGVLLEDYIIHHSASGMPTCDPWVALAAMAMSTTAVRLGTEVTPPSRRRPWKLARELITLDHLSGGRIVLGVGLGDTNDPGFARVGEATDVATRAQMVDESLEIIDGLCTGDPFSFFRPPLSGGRDDLPTDPVAEAAISDLDRGWMAQSWREAARAAMGWDVRVHGDGDFRRLAGPDS